MGADTRRPVKRRRGRQSGPPAPQPGRQPPRRAIADGLRRLAGLLLILLVVVPVFRIVDTPRTGVTGRLMAGTAEQQWRVGWVHLGIALAIGLGAAALLRGRGTRLLERVGGALGSLPRTPFALGTGLLASLLTLWVTFGIFNAQTVLIDASVQLIQARYFATGHLSAPPLGLPEFWSIQFMVHTEAGWVSQYPPGQALALAIGVLIGAPWLIGALAMGITALFTALSMEKLLPDRRAQARAGSVLVAGSPLLLGLAAGYMSHATMAALAALALYCALRAEQGSWGWATVTGAAVGWMVITRPLTGLIIGAVVTIGVWSRDFGSRAPSTARLLKRATALSVGGLPFAIGFGAFNRHFFGSPFRLGYEAAAGPNHGLGFHVDPWGRPYGLADGVGYSSAELVALGRDLLGMSVPVVALIGGYLVIARRLSRGERILLAWAGLPLLASAAYWHHDLVFGPRMLGEAAPAWLVLAVLAAIGLVHALRSGKARLKWASEGLAVAFLVLLAYGVAYGGPSRLQRFASRLDPEPGDAPALPALGFVHEVWSDRLGARLAGQGLRLDSVRVLLSRYPTCVLQVALDRVPEGERQDRCRREQASDARGIVGLSGFLWRGDLPGLPGTGILWARDLGPEQNVRLIERYPDRVPLVLLPPEREADRAREWALVPYEEGIAALWEEPEGGGSPP